jgi:hypothetical protein
VGVLSRWTGWCSVDAASALAGDASTIAKAMREGAAAVRYPHVRD